MLSDVLGHTHQHHEWETLQKWKGCKRFFCFRRSREKQALQIQRVHFLTFFFDVQDMEQQLMVIFCSILKSDLNCFIRSPHRVNTSWHHSFWSEVVSSVTSVLLYPTSRCIKEKIPPKLLMCTLLIYNHVPSGCAEGAGQEMTHYEEQRKDSSQVCHVSRKSLGMRGKATFQAFVHAWWGLIVEDGPVCLAHCCRLYSYIHLTFGF